MKAVYHVLVAVMAMFVMSVVVAVEPVKTAELSFVTMPKAKK
jgi:hypothetical protein